MDGEIRVIIVSEPRLFREGLRAVLHGRGGVDVVADAPHGSGVELLIGRTSPDAIVVDLEGIDQIPRGPSSPPLVVLGHERDRHQIARAFQTGVAALASSSDSPDEVAAAIRAAAAGQIYVTPSVCAADPGFSRFSRPDRDGDVLRQLTAREREVFERVIAGSSTAEIARQLDVSPRTVETHRAHLSRKLGSRSAADLVRFAARHGLLPS